MLYPPKLSNHLRILPTAYSKNTHIVIPHILSFKFLLSDPLIREAPFTALCSMHTILLSTFTLFLPLCLLHSNMLHDLVFLLS